MNTVATAGRIPDETAYPSAGSVDERLRFMLGYAILAPSSHNTQPWRFKIQHGTVELFVDRGRGLPIADPAGREATISCGAALFHLRLALRHFGYRAGIERFPSPADPDLLARIRPEPHRESTAEEKALFAAIPHRRTNRRVYSDRRVPPALLDSLRAAAAAEGAWLRVLSELGEKRTLADLIARGDRIQMGNPEFRRELAEWIHPRRSVTHDGMSGYAFGVPLLLDFATPAFAFAVRRFDMGKGQAARDHELATGSPVLAVLGTERDTPQDWLSAGEALAHVLLRAQVEGVQASYLNQPVQVAELRSRVATAVRVTGAPQLVLRMGYGPTLEPAPRRAVEDVLMEPTGPAPGGSAFSGKELP